MDDSFFKLADFFEVYEDGDILHNKKEYAELAADSKEDIPPPGEKFKHQEFFRRLMRHKNDAVIFDQTGTGKTCEFIGLSEYIIEQLENKKQGKEFDPDVVGFNNEKIFVVSSKLIHREFLEQIVCKCTKGKYELTRKPGEKLESYYKRVEKGVHEHYKWYTYQKLYKEIISKTDDELLKHFDNSVLWIDEIHQTFVKNIKELIRETRTFEKNPEEEEESEELEEEFTFEGEVEEEEPEESKEKEPIQKTAIMKAYKRLFMLLGKGNVKRIVSTATPVFGNVESLYNIIYLYADGKQISFRDDAKSIEKDAYNILYGKLNYVRNLDNHVENIYQGEKYTFIDKGLEISMTLEPCIVKDVQAEFLKEAMIEEKGAFQTKIKQISNLVFGDNNDRKRYFDSENQRLTPEFLRLTKGKNLEKYSAKIPKVVEIVKNAKGVVFIYDHNVVNTGLIAVRDLLLSHIDTLTEFDPDNFTEDNRDDQSYCRKSKFRQEKKSVKYTVAMMTGRNAKHHRILKKIMTDPGNIGGQIIKVFLLSPVADSGISMNHVSDGIVMTPDYNPSRLYQIISRYIRATSHIDLLKQQQEIDMNEGRDPSKSIVKVKTHLLISVIPGEESIELRSVDYQIYKAAFTKNRHNKEIMRYLKTISNGCHVNYNRNTRAYLDSNNQWKSTDTENSEECDFDACLYVCEPDTVVEEIDYSTYDTEYLNYNYNILKKDVEEIFSKHLIASFDEICILINNIFHQRNPWFCNPYIPQRDRNLPRKKHVRYTLDNIVLSQLPIKNRFGFLCFLKKDDDVYYLTRYLTKESNHYDVYYNINLSYGQRKSLETVRREVENEFPQVVPSTVDIKTKEDIKDLTLEQKAALLEKWLLEDDPRKDEIFPNKYFVTPEIPDSQLDEEKQKLSKMTEDKKISYLEPKSTKDLSDQERENYEEIFKSKNQKVTLHTILTEVKISGTEHGAGVMARKFQHGTIRIHDQPKIWRNLKEYEIVPYRRYLTYLVDRRITSVRKIPAPNGSAIWGNIEGGDFKIQYEPSKDEIAIWFDDPRKKKTGIVCTSLQKASILYYLGLTSFADDENLKGVPKNKTTENIIEEFESVKDYGTKQLNDVKNNLDPEYQQKSINDTLNKFQNPDAKMRDKLNKAGYTNKEPPFITDLITEKKNFSIKKQTQKTDEVWKKMYRIYNRYGNESKNNLCGYLQDALKKEGAFKE